MAASKSYYQKTLLPFVAKKKKRKKYKGHSITEAQVNTLKTTPGSLTGTEKASSYVSVLQGLRILCINKSSHYLLHLANEGVENWELSGK